jgi:hypothetical protein
MEVHVKRVITSLAAASLMLSVFAGVASAARSAAAPAKETFFICPSVSTNNSHGMWVMGAHGAYYVLVPTKGGANDGSKVYLTVPVSVPSTAQIPAGWALYKDLPTYPNFEGTVGLLSEGISTWLGSPAGWEEGDMAMIANNGDGSYTVMGFTMNGTPIGSITIDHPIPLASAAIW